MPTSNPLEILVAHNEWSTRQLLEACTKLTDEQFHQRFEMGPGSLHDTTTHLLGALRSWTDMLATRAAAQVGSGWCTAHAGPTVGATWPRSLPTFPPRPMPIRWTK